MAKGKKRMSIPGLVPGEDYVIQVRAVDDGEGSVWSQKHKVLTIDDTAGGTRTPVTCTLTSWEIVNDGRFVATWPTVNANTDGTEMVVTRYELEISSSYGVHIAPHYGAAGDTQSRDFSQAAIKAFFGGVLPGEVTARLRVINSAGTAGGWSNAITAVLPVPYMPTMVSPPGEGVMDGVKVRWGPPVEPFVPGDPRWPAGYRVYVAFNDPNFIPDAVSKSNMIYQGASLEAAYTSMSYEHDHYFKICSYSHADLQSDYITVGPLRPLSPFGPDDTAPLIPQLAEVTLNADRTVSAQANLNWTISEEAEENQDINGFVVAWRIANDPLWRNTYFQKDARSGVIDLPRAFANYEFKIAAYDFVANYSEFSEVRTLEGAGPAPGPLTGVDAITRWDGMKLIWDRSESHAVINGGRYEVQFKPTNSFVDSTPTHTTGDNSLDLSGLQPAKSTWYWRVRAVDTMSRSGPWSPVQTDTLPAFPTSATKDGIKPQTAPANVRATGGLNYINVSWDRVTNTDAVWYEVYMSATNNFAIAPANFAGETSATSIMLNSLPGGPSGGVLQQGKTYYVKVRAMDADGDGPVSSQSSAQLTQIAGGDLGINVSGENLLYNTSFEADSGTISPPSANPDGLANYWQIYNNSPTTEPATPSLVSPGRTGGVAQRITWTGVNTSVKGIYPLNQQGLVRPNTEYTVSFYARASAGTGFNLMFNAGKIVGNVTPLLNPVPSATTWQRYAFVFTSTADPELNNFHATVTGHGTNGGWVEFDDIQMEAGNIPSAYKVGTVSIAKLATGTLEAAIMTIAAGGQIKSADYNPGPTAPKGFLITGTGINLLDGTVNAKTLQAGTTITNDLYVGALLEIAGDGIIQSALYRTSSGTQGYRITKDVIDIRSGMVAAGTLSAGTITSPNIIVGEGGKITVASNGSIQSNNYSKGVTGWKIGWDSATSTNGIEMWDTNSKITVSALETGTLSSTVMTVGSGGEIKSENWNPTTEKGYRLNEQGLTLYNGVIYGSSIQTNQLKSIKQDANGKYTFSLNTDGYLEVSGAWIHGNTRVSDSPNNIIQSGNWNPAGTGWQIRGDGLAQFFQVNTWGLNIYNSAKVGNSSAHSISSFTFGSGASGAGGSGWIIRGDGYAEFNGGRFAIGSVGGGQTVFVQDIYGNGQIKMYQPGNSTNYHYIRTNGQVFEIRGGWGGAIEMYPSTGGGSLVRIAQHLNVTSNASIDNALSAGSATVTNSLTVGGSVELNKLSGTGGSSYVYVGNGGELSRGRNVSSSIRYKTDVEDYNYSTERILSLRPVHYALKEEYMSDIENQRYSGFIAEEALEAGLDDFVLYNEEGEVEAFDYSHFTAAHHKVLQEQQAEIAELKRLVNQLLGRS